MTTETKKCAFKGCEIQLPAAGPDHCDNCVFELHVEIRRLQGISRDAATVEWHRNNPASQN